MINDADKKAMAFKIKALLAKTTEAGCSEAEAMMAAHKAKELLDKYQIDLSELDLREEGTSEASVARNIIATELQKQVGRYCEVKSWQSPAEGKLKFLGLQSDVFFAEWLLLALTSFVQRKTLDYSMNAAKIYQNEVNEFQIGCIRRINARLKEEIERRDAERASQVINSTGRSLMVLKDQIVTEAWVKKNLNLSNRGGTNRGAPASQHYMAGHAAGGEARFARPVARDEFQTRQLTAGAKK